MLATVPFIVVSLLLAVIAILEPSLRFDRRQLRPNSTSLESAVRDGGRPSGWSWSVQSRV